MVENNLNSLAETLAKTGLASSTTQALMMAKNIMGTEKRVSVHFDGKANEIDEGLSRKKTYEEEIQDLIQKTSPEKKDFHYMVSGYSNSRQEPQKCEEEVFTELEDVKKEPSVSEILETRTQTFKEPEDEKTDAILIQQESIEPEPIQNPIPEHITIEESSSAEQEKPKTSFQNQAVAEAIKKAVPVYTDSVLDEDRLLKELMDEQAQEIYSNKPSAEETFSGEIEAGVPNQIETVQNEPKTPEYSLYELESGEIKMESEIEEEEPLIEEKSSDEEFIIPVQEAKAEQQKEEPPKKEFKNPIPSVNLMDHFKFG